jgi:hypothetical protein
MQAREHLFAFFFVGSNNLSQITQFTAGNLYGSFLGLIFLITVLLRNQTVRNTGINNCVQMRLTHVVRIQEMVLHLAVNAFVLPQFLFREESEIVDAVIRDSRPVHRLDHILGHIQAPVGSTRHESVLESSPHNRGQWRLRGCVEHAGTDLNRVTFRRLLVLWSKYSRVADAYNVCLGKLTSAPKLLL